jgi:hypothetical protein
LTASLYLRFDAPGRLIVRTGRMKGVQHILERRELVLLVVLVLLLLLVHTSTSTDHKFAFLFRSTRAAATATDATITILLLFRWLLLKTDKLSHVVRGSEFVIRGQSGPQGGEIFEKHEWP